MADIDYLGHMPLFVGVESEFWSLAQFQQAANAAKSLGITSLLIKVGDEGSLWYQNIGGWQVVLKTVEVVGIKAVPYVYCPGDAQSDSAILKTVMEAYGIVVADIEVEYNNRPDWAAQIRAALGPIPGILGITTWGNPIDQQWRQNMIELAPATNFWMPQAYSDYLAGLYKTQYAGYAPIYPIFYLGTLPGSPNNLLQNVKDASSPIIAFWEYQQLANYANEIRAIIAQFGGTMTTPAPNQYQIAAAAAEWKSIAGDLAPSFTTGIAAAWRSLYYQGKHMGPPLSPERDATDWSGNPIKFQEFPRGHCEWDLKTSTARWFDGRGEIL